MSGALTSRLRAAACSVVHGRAQLFAPAASRRQVDQIEALQRRGVTVDLV